MCLGVGVRVGVSVGGYGFLKLYDIDESQLSGGVNTSAPSSATAIKSEIEVVSDTIAALLDYNQLDPRGGFEAFDVDEDDLVSMQDLHTAAESLALLVEPQHLESWFQRFNTSGSGRMTEEEWAIAIQTSDPAAVLASRGVILSAGAGQGGGDVAAPGGGEAEGEKPANGAAVAVSEDATKTSDSTRVEEAAAQLAAALRYNGLSLDDGFSAVDTDDDGKIVLDDMRAAAEQLGLQVGRV